MNENASKMAERFDSDSYTVADLLEIMKILRAEDGCPWDKEQTHESIRKNLIEETYEVVEAIDNSDDALMREELGDLLLQVVFHARIAQENGYFDFDDVCNDVCKKLIIRHPHIFADVEADTSEKVLENCQTPILFIHGTDDSFVPVEMTYRNYRVCSAPKRLFVVPGANHGMSYYIDPVGYQREMNSFFLQYD